MLVNLTGKTIYFYHDHQVECKSDKHMLKFGEQPYHAIEPVEPVPDGILQPKIKYSFQQDIQLIDAEPITVFATIYDDTDFPGFSPCITYIVPKVTAEKFPKRPDFYYPFEPVYHPTTGEIVGYLGLGKII